MQVPTGTLAEVVEPISEAAGSDDALALVEDAEAVPFSEFTPEPDFNPNPFAEELPIAEFVEVSDDTSDVAEVTVDSTNDDAAVVIIDDFNPQQTLSTRLDVDQLDLLYQEALVAYRKGNFSVSEAKLTTLLQHAPDHKNGRLRLASILEEQGQLEAALQQSGRLIDDFGLSSEAVLLKGRIQKKLGQAEDAVATYTSLVEAGKASSQVVNERADLLLQLKQYDAAIQDLSTLIDGKRMLSLIHI